MAFLTLEKITSAAMNKMPASVSLSVRKGGKRAMCFLTVREELMKDVGADERTKFVVEVGTGDDAGIMRLTADQNAGIIRAVARKNRRGRGIDCYVFNLRHIALFPNRAEPNQHCDAHVAGRKSIVVMLPDWAKERQVLPPAALAKPIRGLVGGVRPTGDEE